jgi:hypothetical protein
MAKFSHPKNSVLRRPKSASHCRPRKRRDNADPSSFQWDASIRIGNRLGISLNIPAREPCWRRSKLGARDPNGKCTTRVANIPHSSPPNDCFHNTTQQRAMLASRCLCAVILPTSASNWWSMTRGLTKCVREMADISAGWRWMRIAAAHSFCLLNRHRAVGDKLQEETVFVISHPPKTKLLSGHIRGNWNSQHWTRCNF